MMRLGWFFFNLVQGIFTVAWTAFWILVALLTVLLTGSRRASFWLARHIWTPGLLLGAGARVRIIGGEQLDLKKTYFFAANHQSIIDIPVLMKVLSHDLHFIVKKELKRVPFLGWYISAMGMIFIARAHRKESIADLERAGELIRSGRSVLCFPEATRSRSGQLNRFKKPAFGPAIAAGVDVVPVAIHGTRHVLPADGFRVRPGRVWVRIGCPIPTTEYQHSDRDKLARQVEQSIEAMLTETESDS